MPMQTVTYRCGHRGRERVYGSPSERETQAREFLLYDCPECRHRRAIDAAIEAARAAQAAGLPPLRGTQRQVAWAEVIRAKKFPQLLELRAKALTISSDADIVNDIISIIDDRLYRDSASAWIDSRNTAYDEYWLSRVVKDRERKQAQAQAELGKKSKS